MSAGASPRPMQWFADVAKISLFEVFPLFLACQGLATAWVRWRAR